MFWSIFNQCVFLIALVVIAGGVLGFITARQGR